MALRGVRRRLTHAVLQFSWLAAGGVALGIAFAYLSIFVLKRINDAEGHEAGDEAIRSVANAIRKRIRADDLLFRWGGDEFLVVMPGANRPSKAGGCLARS